MNEPLPHFRYHPDPVASGSIVARQVRCACCRQQRRFVYVGPVYATQDFTEKICPWCIASGAAARDLKAQFSDAESLASQDVPTEVIEEVVARTPGYLSWQGSEWLAHCKDACAFLGDAAVEDVRSAAESTVSDWCATNRQDRQGWLAATQDYVPGGQPAFYKFQCLHCNNVRLGWDFH